MYALSQPQFLYLTTVGWKTGRPHQIEIWFVEHSGKYYVVSEHYERSHWVQNILRNPRVEFTVGGRAFHGIARPVEAGSEPAAAVSKLMDAKYRWSQGLIVELAP